MLCTHCECETKAIPGWEDYRVCKSGHVLSYRYWNARPNDPLPRLVTPVVIARGGYHRVTLSSGKKRSPRLVHQLVLELFVGPRPKGRLGLHRDGNPVNNKVENLYWGTHKDNIDDAKAHGTFVTAPGAQISVGPEAAKEIIESKLSSRAIAPRYGVSSGTICRVRKFPHFYLES